MNLITSLVAMCAWVVWGYTVLFVDPSAPLAPLAFYASLFVALTGTLARLLAGNADVEVGPARPAPTPRLGHAAIVSTLLLFALWLQSFRMLTPFNGLLLAAMFAFIELGFYVSGGRRRVRPRRRMARRPLPDPGLAHEQ